ncbi:unnamed protein product [Amoebophrya sp. A25]|nr:unnamed protein product [Amoebophrya sp. A25]|eukprot:GSA25T00006766001.1
MTKKVKGLHPSRLLRVLSWLWVFTWPCLAATEDVAGEHLHVYTIGTRMNPLLFYLQHSGEMHNIAVLPRGMGDPILQKWSRRALQQKLVYHMDEAVKSKDRTILLFVDAYDVLLEAGKTAILERFRNLQKKAPSCKIFFSAEENCGSACEAKYLGAYANSPTLNSTSKRGKYLCSGGFIGEASALADLFKRYPIQEFASKFPEQSEQYYWVQVWGGEYEQSLKGKGAASICLDDESAIFASNLGFSKLQVRNQQVLAEPFVSKPPEEYKDDGSGLGPNPGFELDFAKAAGSRVTALASGTNPVVLHWNGFWKTNIYRTYLELTHAASLRGQFWQNVHLPGPETKLESLQLLDGSVGGGTSSVGGGTTSSSKSSGGQGAGRRRSLMSSEQRSSYEKNDALDEQREESRPLLEMSTFNIRRSLEAYPQKSESVKMIPAAASAAPGYLPGSFADDLSRRISIKDFAVTTFFADHETDAPTFIFLGGTASWAISFSGQISYVCFLLLLIIRLVIGLQLRQLNSTSEGSLGHSVAEDEMETMVAPATGQANAVKPESLGDTSSSRGAEIDGDEETGHDMRPQKGGRRLKNHELIIQGQHQQQHLLRRVDATRLRDHFSDRWFRRLRLLTTLVYLGFVVFLAHFVFVISGYVLASMRLTTFASVARTIEFRVGPTLALWIDRMPILFPALLSAIAAETFGRWLWKTFYAV